MLIKKTQIHSSISTLIFLLSMSYSNRPVPDDLAYQLVLEKINKKIVPISYLDEVFKNEKIQRHKKIPESFARPYEKKSWEQYKNYLSKNHVLSQAPNFIVRIKTLY